MVALDRGGLGAGIDQEDVIALAHGDGAVVLDLFLMVVADIFHAVVLDVLALVLLRLQIDLLIAGLVVEPDDVGLLRMVRGQRIGRRRAHEAVPAHAALGRTRQEARHRLLRRQRPGRRPIGIEQGAHDHRLVGIAIDEAHQHLIADARQEERAAPGAGIGLHHPHADRGTALVLLLPVPQEADQDPALVVGVDFAGTDDDRRLQPRHLRPRPRVRCAKGTVGRDERERGRIVEGAAAGQLGLVIAAMDHFGDQPGLRRRAELGRDLHARSGMDARVLRGAGRHDRGGFQLLHEQLGRVDVRVAMAAAGPEEHLEAVRTLGRQHRGALLDDRRRGRGDQVEIMRHDLRRRMFAADRPAGHAIDEIRLPAHHKVGAVQRVFGIRARDDHLMARRGLVEPVGGAHLIEQALTEIEIGLVVLDGIRANRRGHRSAPAHRRRATLASQLGHDVLGRLVLPGAAIRRSRQQPPFRHGFQPIDGFLRIHLADLTEIAHDAAEFTGESAIGDGDAHHLPDQVGRLVRIRVGDHLGLDQVGPGQCLLHAHAA